MANFGGMNPQFSAALQALFAAAPGGGLALNSGYRTPERQAQLWQAALAKYGSPDAARKWVAPPGRSQHNHGNAADLGFASPEALAWAHANAGRFGLTFPLANENWHIELAGARGQQPATVDPPAPPPTGPFTPEAPVAPAGALAALFMPPQQDDAEVEAERKDAERLRRLALFGG